MPLTDAIRLALSEPLDESVVKVRDQAGQKLSYVEGWYAIAQANAVFGFDGWTLETLETRQVQEEHRDNAKGKPMWYVGYTCRVRIEALGVVRDGCGAGSGIDADKFRAHESAVKEAETDAMKRALRTFGYRFGLALYDKAQANVTRRGKPKGASLSNGKATTVRDKAMAAWEALGADPRDFDAFVSEHGETLAFSAIAQATKEGISLSEAVRAHA